MNESFWLALAISPPSWIKRTDLKLTRFLTFATATFLLFFSLPFPVLAAAAPAPVITVTNVNSHSGATINRDFIEISFTINSPSPVSSWSVQLVSNGKKLGSRSELNAFAASTKANGNVLTSKDGTSPLEAQTPYSTSIAATGAKAFVHDLGVHGFWLQILINGAVVKTIPFFSYGSAAAGMQPTPVSWMLPLVEPAHRDLLGDFIDDDLAKELAPDGRLGRILNFGNGPRVTWLIDPYLIESVEAMTHGYTYAQNKPGTGRTIATAWLEQLRVLVADGQVVALPYGDPDLVTLAQAGLENDLAQALNEGVIRLSTLLNLPVARTAAWPFNGLLDKKTQALIESSGIRNLLLSSDAITSPQTATGPSLFKLQDANNQLVFDSTLSKQFKKLTPLSANRVAAELTMITAERPAISRAQLILPPRLWDPNNESRSTLSTGVPIQEVSLADLEGSAKLREGTIKFSSLKPLGEGEVLSLEKITKNLKTFSSVIPAESHYTSDALLRSRLLLASSGRSSTLNAYLYSLRALTTSQQVVRQVRVLPGQYTLTSLHQKLPITIANDSPEPATIVLRLVPTTFRVLKPADVSITIAPESKTQVMIPIDAVTSGDLALSASVLTPNGEILGDVPELLLRIRTVPAIATWIMEGAGALLILGAGAQIFRRMRSRTLGTITGAEVAEQE